MTHCGGWGPIQTATPKVQELCNKVILQIEEKLALNISCINALQYIEQAVSGDKYRILAQSCDHYLLINIRVPFHGAEPELGEAVLIPNH
ncbi:hypothetical protein AAFF_G00365280 [Aldrovandia affinis]|uniref:Uncharacterized protein n=1 Tax=Aldrovandia affinis TaxID=143900 RepID=A0AAD7R557_9TELE|nr:hypothetical protein AAFF_G00365280 [Aldrovandia affinis]